MAKTYALQSSFNKGVLDKTMRARMDTEQYFQGVEQADNISFIPQGGARRRPGTEYIATLTGESRIIPLVMSNTQRYILAFSNNQLKVFRADTNLLIDTITTSYTTAQLFELDFAQSGDDMLIVHEDHVPRIISRDAPTATINNTAQQSNVTVTSLTGTLVVGMVMTGTGIADNIKISNLDSTTQFDLDTDLGASKNGVAVTFEQFKVTDVTFVDQPTFDFNDAISPSPTSEVQSLVFGSVTDSAGYKLNLEGLDTETLSYDDTVSHALEIQDALLSLFNTPDKDIAVVRASANTFTITFSDSAAKNWRDITGRRIDGGTGTITATQTTEGSPRTENVWSSNRGYPKTCTFHEGRLWFGGSKSMPSTVFGSYVNSFFNFGFGKGRDDEGIMYQLQTDQNNKIQAIYSARTLQVFTAGGEFVTYQSEFDPITPANIRIMNHTRYGASAVKPTDIEGSVTYVQRTGKAIREMVSEPGQGYQAPSISYLAPSLISNPVELDSVRGTASDDANYILVVNGDGNIAVFNTLKEQQVAAWSLWSTDGDYTSVAVAFDDIYVAVKRVIDSSTVYYLEKFNTSYHMDSTKRQTSVSSATVGSLNHLEGKEVQVKADDAVLLNRTVSSNAITCERSVTNVEVGLPFTVTLKTMPATQQTQAGFNLDQELRISKCTVELADSLGVIINGTRLPDRQLGDPVGTPTTAFTGKKNTPLLGWDKTQQITVTHTDPVGMTLLGLQLEVNS